MARVLHDLAPEIISALDRAAQRSERSRAAQVRVYLREALTRDGYLSDDEPEPREPERRPA